jgi:hypothetical protein
MAMGFLFLGGSGFGVLAIFFLRSKIAFKKYTDNRSELD